MPTTENDPITGFKITWDSIMCKVPVKDSESQASLVAQFSTLLCKQENLYYFFKNIFPCTLRRKYGLFAERHSLLGGLSPGLTSLAKKVSLIPETTQDYDKKSQYFLHIMHVSI